jgi:hypothetical protein
MKTVYRNNMVRQVKESRLEEYLAAGWSTQPQDLAEEIITLKPTAKVRAAVKPAEDSAIDDKGE